MIPVSSMFIRIVAVVGVLLVVAVPATAEDDAFKRGMDLLRDRNSNAKGAVEAFRAAIKEDGTESRRMVGQRLGFGGNPYLPHFFLGEALMKTGDCAGAVAAWARSEEQQVVVGFREQLANLRKWSTECAAKGVLLEREFAQAQAAAAQVVSAASQYLVKVRQAIEANLEVWRSRPELEPQYTEATTQYEAARKALDTGRATRLQRDFADAQAAAGRTNTALSRLEASLRAAADAADQFRRRIQEADQAISTAAREFDSLGAGAGLKPAFARDRQSAGDTITRARDRLATAKKTQNPAAVDEARTLALAATTTLGGIRDQLKQQDAIEAKDRFENARNTAAQAFKSFAGSMTRLDELTKQRSSIAPEVLTEQDALRKRVAAATRRFDAAQNAGNADAIAKAVAGLEAERPRLQALLSGFGPLTLRDRGVPAIIEDGFKLFLEGEHQKVVELLLPEAVDASVPLAAHAHLLRAGSLYTLFVRSGEKDQSLLTSARQDVERAKAADPALRPDQRVFGQRFINFFQTASVPPGQ